jgi:L-iditol 2-dehydrogenase
VAKALGAAPVILVGTRENRNAIGRSLGADHVIDARSEDVVARVKELTGKGADYVVDCAGTETTVNQAVAMTNRGGKICLAAFPKNAVSFNLGALAVNNIYLYGIRGEGKSATHRAMAFMEAGRFDASLIHSHTFALEDLPTALKYARERIDDAIKVVVSTRPGISGGRKAQ